MAEGVASGASGLLFGGRGAQAAADALQRTLTRLDQSVQRAVPVFDTIGKMGTGFKQGQGGGSWNRGSNWVGSNGGGATFSGQEAKSHRADVPTMYTGSNGVGGARRAPGPHGLTTAAAVGGAAVGIGSQLNQNVGQTPQGASDDSRLMMFASQQFQYGGKRANYTEIYTRGLNNLAQSGADFAQASMLVSRSGGGRQESEAWRSRMASAAAGSLANPTVGLAQSAASQKPLYTATGWNQMRRVGIRTYAGGKTQSITQIAQQILSQVGLATKRLKRDEIDYVLWDPMSGTSQTLSNWVANGLITPDQVDAIKDQMQMILTARSKGVDAEKLNTLVAQSTGKGKGAARAKEQLKELGVGDTTMQAEKDVAGAQRQGTVQRLEGFEAGLNTSTKALEDFHTILNTITGAIPGLNWLTGGWRGLGENGLIGKGLGLLGGAAKGIGGVLGIGGGGEPGGGLGIASQLFGGAFSEAAAITGVVGSGVGAGSSLGSSGGTSMPTGTSGGMATDTGTGGSTGGGGGGTSAAPTLPAGDYSNMFGGVKPWVARAGVEVRNKFGVRDIGGVGTRGNASDHPKGLALDFMVYDNKSKGDKIAAYVVANRRRLGVTYVIWYKRIFHTWGEWGPYSHPSGSTDKTSLHMDHVHVSFVTKDPGHGGGTNTGGNTGSTGSPTGNRAIGQRMAAARGWTGNQWTALDALWTKESNWRVTADNPTSSAYGIPQAMLSIHMNSLPAGYVDRVSGSGSKMQGYGGSAQAQIGWGLNYIKQRYGSPQKAWDFHRSHNWYDKGAWEIKQDEDARVHKGEMIVPSGEADQIREILMNGNAYGATSRGSRRGGGGVVLEFKPGSIVVHAGAGSSTGQSRALGKGIVDAIAQDERIKALQNGVYTHG